MSRGEARQAEMPETNRKVLRRRRGVVGQENERSAEANQSLNKILRARDELILPVDHAIHVYQVSCLHKASAFGVGLNWKKPFVPPNQTTCQSGFQPGLKQDACRGLV